MHRALTPLLSRAAPLLFDVVVTNVPFPRLRLALDGMPLREPYPIVPLTAGRALAVAMLSHDDSVHIILLADCGAIPDLPRLAAVPAALNALAPRLVTTHADTTGPDRGQAAREPLLPVPRARVPADQLTPRH